MAVPWEGAAETAAEVNAVMQKQKREKDALKQKAVVMKLHGTKPCVASVILVMATAKSCAAHAARVSAMVIALPLLQKGMLAAGIGLGSAAVVPQSALQSASRLA